MDRWQVINGNCLDVMRGMADASIDAVVTDPPYGLEFMGKEWDKGVPGVPFWAEVLRVAKPGAHLLAFGGTRTYHRLACAIEDAGWEIRDCVMWVYGCLSEDTEVLTKQGWERYNKAKHKEILAYDHQADIYQWERPSRWSIYQIESDTAYRIESDHTDQIVSRNHRCLVERGGVLAFVAAEECAGLERVPYLQGDISSLPTSRRELLFSNLLREGEGLAQASFSEWQGQEAARERVGWGQEPGVERWPDVLQAERQVCRPTHKVCPMPGAVYEYVPQGRLRHGASVGGGDRVGATTVADRVRTPHQPRCNGQSTRELDALCVELGSQAVRTRSSYRTTLATVTPIEYTGLIFCPTVSTGAFVARRNGKVFVTGNSGFPKSLDVSKAIDKAAGAEREILGITTSSRAKASKSGFMMAQKLATAPATDEARQWEGWGTALKPAWEPVIVARKRVEGTVAENVLKYGTGGINVDGCRIGTDDTLGRTNNGQENYAPSSFTVAPAERTTFARSDAVGGRWPANIIHDGSDEVVRLFPETGPSKANARGGTNPNPMDWGNSRPDGNVVKGHDDIGGSAARFFYTAKADSSERPTVRVDGQKCGHPTVKPVDLMRYLCRLVTPPGGKVLDPFAGSGSTLQAALEEGFSCIGIELNPEYVALIHERLRGTTPSLFGGEEAY